MERLTNRDTRFARAFVRTLSRAPLIVPVALTPVPGIVYEVANPGTVYAQGEQGNCLGEQCDLTKTTNQDSISGLFDLDNLLIKWTIGLCGAFGGLYIGFMWSGRRLDREEEERKRSSDPNR